jgi:hypothetical protein
MLLKIKNLPVRNWLRRIPIISTSNEIKAMDAQ